MEGKEVPSRALGKTVEHEIRENWVLDRIGRSTINWDLFKDVQ